MANEEFRIESGVPLPPGRGPKGESKYPIRDMQPGDSFFIPTTATASVRSSLSYWTAKYTDRRFCTRTVDGGIRIWRLE